MASVAAEPLPSLDDLLKEYHALGLPMPPEQAKLVRYEAGGGGIVDGKVEPKLYGLAFLVKLATKTENPYLLSGTFQWRPVWNPHPEEVKTESAVVKDLDMWLRDGLGLAIQCHARGWDKLAKNLLANSQKDARVPVRRQLIQLAWYYWKDHLTQPETDRVPVAKRLKELIGQDKELDTAGNRALLKSLDLALVPSKAKPGSIEALIDDLVDYNANTGTMGSFERDDRYWRIASRGFDAVPALIDHLDDERLTRAMMEGFNNFWPWHLRVRDVVSDLLEGLAGHPIGRDWLRRQQAYRVEKAAAMEWWEKARKMGEEAYLLDHVLTTDTPGGAVHLVKVILAKYPKHIPSLYRTVLDKHSQLDSWPLAQAILQCDLPAKEKVDLFVYGAKCKDNKHRLRAFLALKEVDKKQFTSLLIATLEEFPNDVEEPYWRCPEAFIARLAVEADDPRVWQTLEKVAKRSALGLRMELLNHFSDPRDTRYREERLRLLAGFLDDATLWVQKSSPKFDGPGAGFPYDKLLVKDFVAIQIAHLVGMHVEVNLERTAEEWAEIRKQVQEAVRRELKKTDRESGIEDELAVSLSEPYLDFTCSQMYFLKLPNCDFLERRPGNGDALCGKRTNQSACSNSVSGRAPLSRLSELSWRAGLRNMNPKTECIAAVYFTPPHDLLGYNRVAKPCREPICRMSSPSSWKYPMNWPDSGYRPGWMRGCKRSWIFKIEASA